MSFLRALPCGQYSLTEKPNLVYLSLISPWGGSSLLKHRLDSLIFAFDIGDKGEDSLEVKSQVGRQYGTLQHADQLAIVLRGEELEDIVPLSKGIEEIKTAIKERDGRCQQRQ